MRAITVSDRDAGVSGLSLTELPYPEAADNEVIVRVHAAGFTPGELDWPHTWTDRAGRDRTPSVPGHELSGVVAELGYGTTGLTVGQRVFGLVDWARNGSLAEYSAVETRNLAPLPIDIDHTVAAALPISGLSAWQGLFDHGRLAAGQTVLIHGAAGGVGSIAVQLAREVGARVIGTGRTADRDRALELGVAHVPGPGHRQARGRRGSRCGVRRDRRRHSRPLDRTGARRRHAGHHRRAAQDPAGRRAGISSSWSNPIAPDWPTSPREYGMDASTGRGCGAAPGPSRRRIRPRQTHPRQNDPARSRRLKRTTRDQQRVRASTPFPVAWS